MANNIGNRRSTLRTYLWGALVAVVVTAGGLLVLGILFSERSELPPMTGQAYWTIIQGLSALVAASALMGSAVFALMQYWNSRHERHLTIYTETFARLMSDEQIEARRRVYTKFQFGQLIQPGQAADALKNLQPAERVDIKTCLNTLDYLGFLVAQGWLDDDKTLGWLSPIVVQTWDCLKPLVQHERTQRGNLSYYLHCDVLAERCEALDKTGKRLATARTAATWRDGTL